MFSDNPFKPLNWLINDEALDTPPSKLDNFALLVVVESPSNSLIISENIELLSVRLFDEFSEDPSVCNAWMSSKVLSDWITRSCHPFLNTS
jgi:hypothetical protein